MEIIIPGKNKQAIHPIAIFRQAWGVCLRNFGKLGVIYLIFNLPFAIFYLTPMANGLNNQELVQSKFIWIMFPILLISIWGHIALLLGSKKAIDLEAFAIGQSIGQVKAVFLKYLGTIMLGVLFSMGVSMLAGVSVVITLALLLKINKILAALICLALTIAAVACLVYFMLRWSLATIICVFENARPVAALKRSLTLIADYVYPVVWVYCLIVLMYFISLLPVVILGAFLGIGNNVDRANQVGMAYSTFINIFLVPFCTIATVLLYKKLKEAL